MRDYLSIVRVVEALYPAAVGTNADPTLRLNLVSFFNQMLQEVDRIQRWSQNYNSATFVTVQGTQTYTLTSATDRIRDVYWMDQNNKPAPILKGDRLELMRVYGENLAPTSNQGSPQWYSLNGATTLELFPSPDFAGPTTGNYTITVEGYSTIPLIVETTGTTTGASVTLTVPSTAFLTDQGLAVSSLTTGLSVRGAGNLGAASVADDLSVAGWSAFPSGTTVTMTAAAVGVTTAVQTFFNSKNWLITTYPKLAEFGMLREVAAYLQDDGGLQRWQTRYAEELEKAVNHDLDRQMTAQVLAAGSYSQRASIYRKQDYPGDYEVRGMV